MLFDAGEVHSYRKHSCYHRRGRAPLPPSVVPKRRFIVQSLPWYLRDCQKLPEWLCRFHKEIMKAFVLFFFSVKLIVIARITADRHDGERIRLTNNSCNVWPCFTT